MVIRRGMGRNQIVVPAALRVGGRTYLSSLRYAPLLLFVCGLPFFFLALADPYSSMERREVSYPGRRIALLIDASSSMMVPFPSSQLRNDSLNEAAFLTTVAAAEALRAVPIDRPVPRSDRPGRIRR